MDSKDLRVLILSAGKIDTELEKIFGKIPSGLIPLNGKPVIFRIIDKFLDEGIEKISITVGYKKEILEKIISEQYENKCKIDFITTEFHKPPGNSIKTAMEFCIEKELLIILGDTLIENNLLELVNKGKNFVITSQEFGDTKNWCIVTKKDRIVDEVFDKEELDKNKNHHALVGCYFFNDVNMLKKILSGFDSNDLVSLDSLNSILASPTADLRDINWDFINPLTRKGVVEILGANTGSTAYTASFLINTINAHNIKKK